MDEDVKARIIETGNKLVAEIDKLSHEVPHGPYWHEEAGVMEWNMKYEKTARKLIEARVAMRDFLSLFRTEQ